MATDTKTYDPSSIEAHWQRFWDENKTFRAEDFSDKPKKYFLDMFPYPSGAGLHVGHPEGWTANDILSRYYKARGYNVLHPMGWDAFGLPAEQYAIKTGTHPATTTKANIENFTRQIKAIGFAIDWEREINTTDPGYYKWTQWIFLQLFKAGLAYVDNKPVWFCPDLGTVLANEEVLNTPEGPRSERGNYPVERRPLRQWVLRITKYADKLLDDLKLVDWPASTKKMQQEWIGRSEGAHVVFDIAGHGDKLEVYTTRPDTLYGCTYMVVAPEHPLVNKITTAEQKEAVLAYIEKISSKSDLERTDLAKEKTGVWTGAYGINPVNGKQVPIWVADYVLISYGTGAIMAVPAHDERDYEFAQEFGLEIIQVIDSGDAEAKLPFSAVGTMMNSGEFDGTRSDEGKARITAMLEEQNRGKAAVNYKLRDWLFSRQRYWGEPFPIVWVSEEDYVKIKAAGGELSKDLPAEPVSCEMEANIGAGASSLRSQSSAENPPLGFNPNAPLEIAEGDLPHWEQENVTYFVTFRLADSLPTEKLEPLLLEKKEWLVRNQPPYNDDQLQEFQTKFSEPIDQWLAENLGECVLKDPTNAKIVADALKHFDGERYTLVNYVVMPNHVHVTFTPKAGHALSGILHSWKSFTAQKINERSGGKGTLWQRESFDTIIRSEKHLHHVSNYVEANQYAGGVEFYQRRLEAPAPTKGPAEQTYFAVPLPDSQLPLQLPETENYQPSPTGESPLANVPEWLNVFINIKTGETVAASALRSPTSDFISGFRETNTMPQWAGSCWYYLRYLDPRNNERFIDPEIEKYWGSPDLYIGGAEHSVLHLLYARFWHKFLYDQGHVSTPEPFQRLFHQGIILGEDNQKMSKSRGNVVNPDEVIKKYGADALRLYEMFMGPLEAMKPWQMSGMEGISRFLRRVFHLVIGEDGEVSAKITRDTSATEAEDTDKLLHETIKKVTEDIEALRFNTGISQMMIFLNHAARAESINLNTVKQFLQVLAPYAPHLTEELWERIGEQPSIVNAPWPLFDESKLKSDTVQIGVLVNGKARGEILISPEASEQEAMAAAQAVEKVNRHIDGKTVRKVIYKPGKILNIVAN